MSFRTESKVKLVNKSPERIFKFISDFHNFHDLVPSERVENWTCTKESCSFTLKGFADLTILVKDKQPHKLVQYSSAPGAKFPFDLFVSIEAADGEKANCMVYMDLHMNPAIKILAQKPIRNFVNAVADKLDEVEF
jgi:hypothetical protein